MGPFSPRDYASLRLAFLLPRFVEETSCPAMVFKPFKPPLARKAQSASDSADDNDRPTKKARLSEAKTDINADTRLTLVGARKPLLQVRNEKEPAANKTRGSISQGLTGNERFFNVLWYVRHVDDSQPLNLARWNECTSNQSFRALLGESQVQRRTKLGMAMVSSHSTQASSHYGM